MPDTSKIEIHDLPGQDLAEFVPKTQTVLFGDLVFWVNNTADAHQPAIKNNQGQVVGLVEKIPGRLAGQPAPSSDGLALSAKGTFNYFCAFHQTETGTINVTDTVPVADPEEIIPED